MTHTLALDSLSMEQFRFDLAGSFFFADAVQNLKKKAMKIISFIFGFIAKNNMLCR